QLLADRLDGGLLANTGQHILQRTPRWVVIEHLVGGEQRHLRCRRKTMQPCKTAPVVAAVEQTCRQPHAIGAAVAQLRQDLVRLRGIEAMRQREDEKLALGEVEEIGKLQMALALLDPLDIVAALAAGEQLAEPAVSRAVARIDKNIRRAV